MKNSTARCMCGCGEKTAKAKESRRGYKRGEPMLYIRGHSSRKPHEYEVDDNGCWIWQKFVDANGYGKAFDGEKVISAHRYSYNKHVGLIPHKHELHHTCGVKACINPDHLRPLTRREHMALEGRLPYGNAHAKVAA